jgi:hypothetical protein
VIFQRNTTTEQSISLELLINFNFIKTYNSINFIPINFATCSFVRESQVRMIYTIPHVILSARCLIPAIMLMGSTTSYWLGLTIIRLVTLPFGEKYYQLGDQRLLSSMISMFGFFFENWSGVEYCFYGDSLPLEPESVLYISNHRCTGML